DHEDLALVRPGVHADHGDVLAGQVLQRVGHRGGVLRRHDDRLGTLRHQGLHVRGELGDLVLRVGPVQGVDVHVLDPGLDVLGVRVPEVGVGAGLVDADLPAAGTTAGTATAGTTSVATGGGQRHHRDDGDGNRRSGLAHGSSLIWSGCVAGSGD